MKIYRWDYRKNQKLKKQREITFERMVCEIEKGKVLSIIEHPNLEKYPNQKIYEINIDNYVFLVPFTETESEIFLKTIIPSRKATKKHGIKW